ncbi:MAG: ATP-dependent DNA helicase RecG [Eubacteriales bacterium]|nr:ATP-dependent DNA helicase RecG [Eubacteriales bacterium]
MELSALTGIGKTRLDALHAAGIFSLRDLLYAVPWKYRDASQITLLKDLAPGRQSLVKVLRQGEAKRSFFGAKKSRVTCTFTDESGSITACWFNQPWMRENLNKGTRFFLCGMVEGRQMLNPTLEKEIRIVPLYRPIEGLPQRTHETIVRQALEYASEICTETLPQSLRERYDLWPCDKAVCCLHSPASMEDVAKAQRRLAFEQILLYQAAVRMVKELRSPGFVMKSSPEAQNDFWLSLPFSPTNAQRRTLREIADDLAKERAMARMVQGDVGSGKTAVAMGAMLLCAQAGYQCALMAPTEILARQHYEGMKPYYEARGIACGLLVGGMAAKERRKTLAGLANGTLQIAIGTHALIGKSVCFAKLGLCVTDEQHRFGVAQRTALLHKGIADGQLRAPHLLVMSATPIPRSLALILFGDLDLSLIDEMPPGRLAVKTRIVSEDKRADMYGFLRDQLHKGRQAYIVCPLVEESENADGLKSAKAHAAELAAGELNGFSLGLTYGTQPAADKQEALRAFTAGELQVLISTTVIEVGVNVPNATVMVVEDADRYGLAQLHQLRGRVGRGKEQSWCFLLSQPNERLRALSRTNDGFEIARADLELRGPGELLGTRQHGESSIPGGAAIGSMALLYEASQCAEELSQTPALQDEWETVKALARQQLTQLGDQVSIS